MPAAVADAGVALTSSLPVTLTPDQARLVGSAVQIATFEILASVLLSIAATAWAAAGPPSPRRFELPERIEVPPTGGTDEGRSPEAVEITTPQIPVAVRVLADPPPAR